MGAILKSPDSACSIVWMVYLDHRDENGWL